MPSYTARMEYVKVIQQRYLRAAKQEKGRILEEFCRVNGYNRKYAIRLLNGPTPTRMVVRRRRTPLYNAHVIALAEAIWKAAGFPCGPRLKAVLALWLPWARKRFDLSAQVEAQLRRISPRQLDERLRPKKRLYKRRFYATTRPGSLLKRMIPIRTFNGDIRSPGFLEIDLVAHCGSSLSGTFLYTLNATDLHTGWTERRAVMGKGQSGVFAALKDIVDHLPFPLRGLDSDNGEEFINHHLLRFCHTARPRIAFTRSRPYKKDDNAHIEQKNFTHVRRIFGWDRYDTEQAMAAMNALYANDLRLFQNLFQPSAKLHRRRRVGTRLVRLHDAPRTPLDRLAMTPLGRSPAICALKAQRDALDPFALSALIDKKLDALFRLASDRPRGAPQIPALTNFASPDFRRRAFTDKQKQHRIHMAAAIRTSLHPTQKENRSVTS